MIKSIVKNIFVIITDALFPLDETEKRLLKLEPDEAIPVFSPAVKFDSSVLPLMNTSSLFTYKDKLVEKLVWTIKYKKSAHSAKIAAYALCAKISGTEYKRGMQGRYILIIPMPISKRRRRERGFNQCELIMDEMKKIDNNKGHIYAYDILERDAHTDRHTTMSRKDRLNSGSNLFSINESAQHDIVGNEPLENFSVMIIDDVITTGSTMSDAQNTFARHGFRYIHGLSIAH